MDEMESMVTDNDKRLSIHEAVCAERYAGIQQAFAKGTKRMQKIEYLLYALIGAVLLGPNFAAKLIDHLIGS
jgi:hypothetical protein